MHKIKSFFYRFRKAPRLDAFESMESALGKERPKARPAFQEQLKGKLLARHQDLREARLENSTGFFRMHQWATVTAAVFLLVVAGGGSYVVSADAPVPQTQTIAGLGERIHPNIAPITITFDQPMMKGSVENSFFIEPYVDGRFIWENAQKVHFLPNKNLSPGEEYTVTVSSRARSVAQKPMGQAYERVFQSVPMQVNQQLDLRPLQELRQNIDSLTPEQKRRLREQLDLMDLRVRELIDSGVIVVPPPRSLEEAKPLLTPMEDSAEDPKPAEEIKPVEDSITITIEDPKPAESVEPVEEIQPVEDPKPLDDSKPLDDPKPADASGTSGGDASSGPIAPDASSGPPPSSAEPKSALERA